jgi:hypothetical protein
MEQDNIPPQDIFTIAGFRGANLFDLQKDTNLIDFKIEADKTDDLIKLGGIYVADPFILISNNRQYLFFELLLKGGKGVIGRAERKNETDIWTNFAIVLEEAFHLSYPLISQTSEGMYMSVESAEANEVRLYKAKDDSLNTWVYERGILSGKHYDPTIFQHENTWFMFTCTELDFSVANLFFSRDGIVGPWLSHPKSPIIQKDAGSARPAGPVLEWNSKKYRLAQDCSERYGAAVKAFEIVTLTLQQYQEKDCGILLSGSGSGWNAYGMHQLQIYKKESNTIFVVADGYDRV